MNKLKIVNDPVYGFINIPFEIIYDLIEHKYFQRLRRINQLGLTQLVYPGALHTRFHHALGAMHLMSQAIDVLRSKEIDITDEEAMAATIAILLHDIGHGPFSHALEHSLVEDVSHETISILFMNELNQSFNGQLGLAIKIFENTYTKKFLHQLVSSQLDMDRLDYLNRDSFFTGVSEGVIGYDRIIKMLTVQNDQLAVEAKGIYSIEKFIIARRLMYWQVYFHKTVIATETLLTNILKRAKFLANQHVELFATSALKFFLYNKINAQTIKNNINFLPFFAELDDNDITASIKEWTKHQDKILSTLSQNLINRKLYKVIIQDRPFNKHLIEELKNVIARQYHINQEETEYFVVTGSTSNSAYNPQTDRINILFKDGQVKDIAQASDQLNILMLSNPVEKFFICFPKDFLSIYSNLA